MKNYDIRDDTTVLNFEIIDRYIEFDNITALLNFNIVDRYIEFSNTSTLLNFEIRTYDERHPLYRILIDWLESFTFGDIF